MPNESTLKPRLFVVSLILFLGGGWGCTGRYAGENTKSNCITPECLEEQEIPAGYCTSDVDCAADEFCASGLCEERTPTSDPETSCTSHNDCTAGQFCNLALCTTINCHHQIRIEDF